MKYRVLSYARALAGQTYTKIGKMSGKRRGNRDVEDSVSSVEHRDACIELTCSSGAGRIFL